MKSEVKKKMMLDEHATPTPKSLKRAEVEKFCAGNLLIASVEKNFHAKLHGIVFYIRRKFGLRF
jgi:hypothetical protein